MTRLKIFFRIQLIKASLPHLAFISCCPHIVVLDAGHVLIKQTYCRASRKTRFVIVSKINAEAHTEQPGGNPIAWQRLLSCVSFPLELYYQK